MSTSARRSKEEIAAAAPALLERVATLPDTDPFVAALLRTQLDGKLDGKVDGARGFLSALALTRHFANKPGCGCPKCRAEMRITKVEASALTAVRSLVEGTHPGVSVRHLEELLAIIGRAAAKAA